MFLIPLNQSPRFHSDRTNLGSVSIPKSNTLTRQMMILLVFEDTQDRPQLLAVDLVLSKLHGCYTRGGTGTDVREASAVCTVLFRFLWELRRLTKLGELRTASNLFSSIYLQF